MNTLVLFGLLVLSLVSAKRLQACNTDAGCDDPVEYCMKSSCNATAGLCTEFSEFCSSHYDPVCGCDGNTYGNPCLAGAVGINIARVGECDNQVRCFNNSDCKSDLFCAKVVNSCLDPGFCNPRPMECSPDTIPVCGCDGFSYSSECVASSRGISIQALGACPISLPCTLNTDCPRYYYCQRPVGCGTIAHGGNCHPLPPSCSDQTDPVCGCDGKTYPNTCFAALNAMNLADLSECNTTEECSADEDCSADLFCQKEVGACDDPNEVGLCSEMPVECEKIGDQVCGCDGITYPNDCWAYAAGMNIANNTACAISTGFIVQQ